MGSGENIWASSVGLAAFAGWTLSRFTVPRRVVWANVLSGLGILAPSFSTVSLTDDGFQQELICPATSSVRLSARTIASPRRSLSDSSHRGRTSRMKHFDAIIIRTGQTSSSLAKRLSDACKTVNELIGQEAHK